MELRSLIPTARVTSSRALRSDDAHALHQTAHREPTTTSADTLRLTANMELARRLVHALNNALCVILNHAEFLEEDLAGHPAADDVQRVLSGVQKAAEIASGLQSLATTVPDAVPLGSFLRSVTAMVEWESAGLFHVRRPSEVGRFVVSQSAVAELVILEVARWHGLHLAQPDGEVTIGCSIRSEATGVDDADRAWLVLGFTCVGSCTDLKPSVPSNPTPRNLQMLARSIGAKLIDERFESSSLELWLPLFSPNVDA